jgi:hypothetical protein
MEPDQRSDLSQQVEGLVERHGDQVADEMVKTTRFVRRFSVAVVVMMAIGFTAFVVIAIMVISKF